MTTFGDVWGPCLGSRGSLVPFDFVAVFVSDATADAAADAAADVAVVAASDAAAVGSLVIAVLVEAFTLVVPACCI